MHGRQYELPNDQVSVANVICFMKVRPLLGWDCTFLGTYFFLWRKLLYFGRKWDFCYPGRSSYPSLVPLHGLRQMTFKKSSWFIWLQMQHSLAFASVAQWLTCYIIGRRSQVRDPRRCFFLFNFLTVFLFFYFFLFSWPINSIQFIDTEEPSWAITAHKLTVQSIYTIESKRYNTSAFSFFNISIILNNFPFFIFDTPALYAGDRRFETAFSLLLPYLSSQCRHLDVQGLSHLQPLCALSQSLRDVVSTYRAG
jgi:hypothetical protein